MDLTRVKPVTEMRGDGPKDTALLKHMLEEAQQFLASFSWCHSIAAAYFGVGIGGVAAAFLFRILPTRSEVDEWLWVIVGDLPPAYIIADENPTPVSALEAYVEEMTKWVEAVEHGKNIEDLISVNVPPTLENALELKKRLTFLRTRIIPRYSGILPM